MKRFRRILFNTLTAISLLLAIATAGACGLSFAYQLSWKMDRSIAHQGKTMQEARRFTVVNGRCEWEFRWRESRVTSYINPDYAARPPKVLGGGGSWSWSRLKSPPIGLTALPRQWWPSVSAFETATSKDRLISLPLWIPAAVMFGFPATRLVIVVNGRRRRSLLAGLCPACGYDTRANLAKCSECGHEPAPATAPKRDGLTP